MANKTSIDLDLTPLPVICYTLKCPICFCQIDGMMENPESPIFVYTHYDTSSYNDCPNSLKRFAMRGPEVYRI